MSQEPRLRVAPRASKTYGDLAADLAADYGLTPDPWQRIVLDDWLAEKSGSWASLTCGLSVPRQNGKNALIEIRELFGMVGRGEKFLHTAHEVKTARKAFKRLQHFFGSRKDDPAAKFPELNALVSEVRNVNGQEAILLTNGGSVEVVARSKNSARGFTVDVLIMDEAQEMSEDDLEALVPTTSSAPLGNPQWIFTGTPPSPSANGEIFTRIRKEATGESPVRLAWHEWSAERGVDLDDREAWRLVNPALVNGRLQFAVIEGERARFSDGGFARERLGIWDESVNMQSVILPDEWKATAVDAAPLEGDKSFGVKFAPDGSRVAIVGARRPAEGPLHIEIVGAHSGSMAAGTASLAAWLAERWRETAVIVVDGKSHAGTFVNALRDLGVPAKVILTPTWDQVATANAMLLDAVVTRQVTHLGTEGQQLLTDSVLGTTKKMHGDKGAWSWLPIDDRDEIPVAAAALAHFGAKTKKLRTGGAVFA